MIEHTTPIRAAAVLAMVALLAACGGGGSSGPSTPSFSVSGSMSKDSSYPYDEAPIASWTSTGASQVDLTACTTPSLNATNIGSSGSRTFPAGAAAGTYSCTVRAVSAGSSTTTATLTWTVAAQLPPTTDGLVTAIPTLTLSECPRLVSAATPTPALTPGTMQFVGNVLKGVDPNSGYVVFARLPVNVTYWVDTYSTVTSDSIGTAVHETTHQLDSALNGLCNTDVTRHYYLAGTVQPADLVLANTSNYSIVDEVLPAVLKTAAPSRYTIYIRGSGTAPGGVFTILLDEFTAYTNGALAETAIAHDVGYRYLAPIVRASTIDSNAGGVTDFMSYFVAYLRAARLNHPATYSLLQSLPVTRAYMQTLWATAEQALVGAYPYSTFANNGTGFYVSKDALSWVYSPDQLAELDLLGITHASSTAWNTTYLKP